MIDERRLFVTFTVPFVACMTRERPLGKGDDVVHGFEAAELEKRKHTPGKNPACNLHLCRRSVDLSMRPVNQVLHDALDGIPARAEDEVITSLTTCLFDLRAACELQLRTLTSVQRHLERVRRLDRAVPERDLLLTEIARQLQELQDGSFDIARCHGLAERSFQDMRHRRNGSSAE
jgi:hypothetical protein